MLMYGNIFDTHAHYNDSQFDDDREKLLAELPSAGICHVINCGTDIKTSEISLSYSEKYPYISAACGIHPEDCLKENDESFVKLTQLCQHPGCVALGEIGLDYHYDDIVPRERQKYFFEKQLIIAKELDMPVIIHDREAHGDTLELLKKYRPKGVLHCFSGSTEMAEEIIKLGMYIGLGGAVTFKNAKKPVETAAYVPFDSLLLETDCPYMSPVPFRGKRNSSALIPYTAEFIAEIKKCEPQFLIDRAAENACELFSVTV